MSKNNLVALAGRDSMSDPLTGLLRTGAEKLIRETPTKQSIAYLMPRAVRSITTASTRSSTGGTGSIRTARCLSQQAEAWRH